MSTRLGNGRPRLVASAAGRGPAVRMRCRMRLHVDKHGIVQPRPVGRPDRLLPIYRPGAVVEVDTGQGTCLADYHAEIIAESLHACSTVHLISDAADGSAPVIEHGTAFNADGVLRLLRQAIERAAAARGNAAC